MKLSEIYKGQPDIEIKGIAIDSRKVGPGFMFFCLKGLETDGHKYAQAAVDKGAVCIVHSDDIEVKGAVATSSPAGSASGESAAAASSPAGSAFADSTGGEQIACVRVEDTLAESNRAADLFYGRPSSGMTMFGVTGTNGKSTTASIISSIYSAHKPCGYMGTIAVRYGDYSRVPTLTTPDQIEIHSVLAEMRDHGMEAVAMEVSSHGLSMSRTDSVDFDCAIFTNISYDHLDYHKTMDNYLDAKKKLFSGMKKDGVAVLNADDEASFEILKEAAGCKVVTYGTDRGRATATSAQGQTPVDAEAQAGWATAPEAQGQTPEAAGRAPIPEALAQAGPAANTPAAPRPDYYAKDIRLGNGGTDFVLCAGEKEYRVSTNLVALYNIYNLMGAIAAMHQMGMAIEDMIPLLKDVPQVDGRMEIVDEGQDFMTLVDYAHTPDGYEKIFEFAREVTKDGGNIYAVFGSAGKRDKVKRKVLGAIAGKYCRKIFVTEEDPRNETAEDIGKEIIGGIEESGGSYTYIDDRVQAIDAAVKEAAAGDLLLILGKGDETYMYYDEGRRPYPGDNAVARDSLRKSQGSKE